MLREEKGSTLITVLLMIVVFTVIGLSLIGINVNNSKQVSKSGNDIQATNLAEMGTTHLKEVIFTKISSDAYKTKDLEQIKTSLQSELNPIINLDFQVSTSNKTKFKIAAATVQNEVVGNNEILTVKFTTVGISENTQTREISGTIKVTRGRSVSFPPKPTSIKDENTYLNTVTYKFDGIRTEPEYYYNGFTLTPPTTLTYTVTADLYAKGIIRQEANTDLIVWGNAYVENPYPKINDPGNGNLGLMCVEKKLFIYSNQKFDIKKLSDSGYSTCSEVVGHKPALNGVYAKDYEYIRTTNPDNWSKGNLTIENIEYK
ncbi:hypothetical protein [Neobacillus sp. OS1-33]|uniref:type IV pilus modification PilV family protein n=1 Tax=Neobacillus sp. OS1-33 TaxID=3070683 RepID=UPI0027E1311D|nr:hypothetical protein [Neobacillus sp. OS1-33]WML25423.1 hypothetical protein RCG22_21750 [Neobacillus sp. OS1-33]